MSGETTVSLSLGPDRDISEAIRPALVAVHEFGGVLALDTAMAMRLAIVAEEALMNLADHAACEAPVDVTLRLWRDDASEPAGIWVALEDDGPAFDPRGAGTVELPNAERGGGVGLALIRAWADVVDYRSEGGRNRLELRMLGRG